MDKSKDRNILYTAKGEPRGYIEPKEISELWFNTGTKCNLQCSFCFEKSSPIANRLLSINLQDVKPIIDEFVDGGGKRFGFTGGEPFVNQNFLEILNYALDRCPCLVLSNGTKPLENSFTEVLKLKQKPYALSLRISIDSPIEEVHDKERGVGNFKIAMKMLKKLLDAGFEVSVAGRDDSLRDSYQQLFQSIGISKNIPLVFFPELDEVGGTPEITTNCMTTYKTEEERLSFMCNYSKMVVKTELGIGIYACTLVDDDKDYDLGTSIDEAMKKKIILKHQRCFSCFASGVSCGG